MVMTTAIKETIAIKLETRICFWSFSFKWKL